jgi:hypothetical protein
VPVAALVLGGTWALPSSAAFILSAKAGPAKAIAAPSVSVTSMVLFDMAFLPVDVSLKTTIFRIYSRNADNAQKFRGSLWRKVRSYWLLNSEA